MSIPVTWPNLLEANKNDIQYSLNYVTEQMALACDNEYSNVSLSSFQVFAEILYESIVLLGDDSVNPTLELSHGLFTDFVRSLSDRYDKCSTTEKFGILNYTNLLQCSGCTLAIDIPDIQRNILFDLAEHFKELEDLERKQLSLAALAYQEFDLSQRFLNSNNIFDDEFVGGKTFGFNVSEFIQYLGAALKQNAGYSDIEFAWFDFLDCFPRKLAAQTLNWADLFWSARISIGIFQNVSLEDISHSLNRLVRTR
jgi:hypothetical protein